MTRGGRRPHHERVIARPLAWTLCGVALLEAGAAFGLAIGAGASFHTIVDMYLLTNGAIAAAFPICGALLATNRPGNPVGWLFLAMALFHGTSAAAAGLAYAVAGTASQGAIDALYAVLLAFWPWGVSTCLLIALQLFPTGRPLLGRWRWALWFTAIQGIAFFAESAFSTGPMDLRRGVVARNPIAVDVNLSPTNALAAIALALTVTSLVIRYRRGDDTQRQQLLWLLLAVIVIAALNTQRWVTGDGPILLLLSIPLVPIAATIAVLRYRLLDIRIVVNRALVYATLSVLVAAAYIGVVAAAGSAISPGIGAAVLVALAFNPVRLRVQRAVDRAMYGERRDPVRAVSRVGARLATGDDALTDVLTALCETLRLPYATLRSGGIELAAAGAAQPGGHVLPLHYADEEIGELIVGLRAGESQLSTADRRVLDVLANPITLALRATAMSTELQRSREHIVTAREEERRRLRRDLHDGLGPQLTGVAYKADAARNLLDMDPAGAGVLLKQLRGDVKEALDDVRRLVYGLRPPALDEFGLVGALRRQADLLCRGNGCTITVHAPAELPGLPAAIEVAVYRIASEALANVVRHSTATAAQVRLCVDDMVCLEVSDNGRAAGERWESGVGMIAMTERASEVGGTCVAGPTAAGGRVSAELPLGAR